MDRQSAGEFGNVDEDDEEQEIEIDVEQSTSLLNEHNHSVRVINVTNVKDDDSRIALPGHDTDRSGDQE